jgi:hypothetical protein
MAKKPEPPKPMSWDVYKIAKKAMWLGTVEVPDKGAAVSVYISRMPDGGRSKVDRAATCIHV